MGLGMLLSFIGWFLIFQKNYTGFAVLYTIGNCVALCATGFFTGPKKQCKVSAAAQQPRRVPLALTPTPFALVDPQLMMKKGRYIGVMVYFFAMALTLFFAFFKPIGDDPPTKRLFLVLIAVCIQMLALFWYSMSYVPFGHTM